MAIVTSTITVDFLANYAGPHRVCFRILGSGDPYDCTTVVGCVGGGNPCQAIINTPVNTTSCDGPITFEGYIQATCEDILSTSGRLLWSATFVPNQVCDKFNITCQMGAIIGIDNPVRGINYDVGDTVLVTRDGGDPQVDDAIITIDAVGTGVINSITGLLAGGVDYAPLDTINITGGGGGVGAQIRVDTVGGSGEILTFTLVANGAGYFSGPFSFDVTSGIGVGSNFDIVEGAGNDYDDLGALLSFTITDGGLYEIPPVITIDPASGTGAVFGLPPLGGCAQWDNVGVDCIGGDQVDILDQTLEVGSTWATCLEGGLATAIPPTYTVVELGCCIPADTAGTACTDVHLENTTGGVVDVHLTLCGGDDVFFAAPVGTTAVCLVTGGWIDPFEVGFTIVDQGTPCT